MTASGETAAATTGEIAAAATGETVRGAVGGQSPATGFHSAERLLADLRQESARTDAKGSVLVGAQGMAGAALVGVLTSHDWRSSALTLSAQVLWWTGAACFLASLGAVLAAIVPRFRSRAWHPGQPLTHFADIRAAADAGPGVLEEALITSAQAPHVAVLASLVDISRIVASKYWWLRAGIVLFAAALVLLPGSLITG
ncbi:DUF5706 domain-containing protein [Kitasatospora sp. YST-16]|uniref:Pycsar system effector family protein n=1 Tax=Kitasatospora sp. YST-16 TaxID=2998080 RepID=UPI00228395C6|nr:Pycsar system effector family protein [Kitasatospora sp. YST-16]WAL72558.1 DUF5706 domain-containing protein [Kitasatospora sp. YST-16]WNW38605.1 DUF5706 domain-containing protein [Streptomyces sp. Li-HN-5-13]